MTCVGKRNGFKNEKIIDSLISVRTGPFKLLNGKVLFYDYQGLLTAKEIYNSGYPVKFISYHNSKNYECPEKIEEIVDFTKLYNNIKGTYYVEFRSCMGV